MSKPMSGKSSSPDAAATVEMNAALLHPMISRPHSDKRKRVIYIYDAMTHGPNDQASLVATPIGNQSLTEFGALRGHQCSVTAELRQQHLMGSNDCIDNQPTYGLTAEVLTRLDEVKTLLKRLAASQCQSCEARLHPQLDSQQTLAQASSVDASSNFGVIMPSALIAPTTKASLRQKTTEKVEKGRHAESDADEAVENNEMEAAAAANFSRIFTSGDPAASAVPPRRSRHGVLETTNGFTISLRGRPSASALTVQQPLSVGSSAGINNEPVFKKPINHARARNCNSKRRQSTTSGATFDFKELSQTQRQQQLQQQNLDTSGDHQRKPVSSRRRGRILSGNRSNETEINSVEKPTVQDLVNMLQLRLKSAA